MLRQLTFLYSDEQIEEIKQQMPQNIQTCKNRIDEIDTQLDQYKDLIKQLEEKIRRADQLIAERSKDQLNIGLPVHELEANCNSITGRRSSNEDEEVATIVRMLGQPRYQFLAVFDGHGGIDAASFCKQNVLKKCMDSQFTQLGQLGLALQDALIQTDQAYCDIDGQKGSVGTTAACLLIDLRRGLVAAANSGDARVIIKVKNADGTEKLFTTNDHKPGCEAEKARLSENFSTQVYDFGGVMRVNGTLAVSRAIGDLDYKIFGVLALPEVYEEIAYEKVQFAVVACDGLWDVVSNQEVASIVETCKRGSLPEDESDNKLLQAALLYMDEDYEKADALIDEEADQAELENMKVNKKDLSGKIAQILTRIAYLKGSTDNVTVVVALK